VDGIRGYSGWRWIFILEGLLTFVVGVIFLFTFPSFPEETRWLTDDERAYVKARLEADQGRNAAERKITFRDVITVMKDYKIWLGGFMYFGMIVPAYGYAYFSPTIIQSYHYSAIETQLRSVPPWAASFGFGMIIATLSDWHRHRFLYAICPIFIAVAGFGILINVHHNLDLQYAALFLVCLGTYSAMPVMVCWFNMNLGGHHRRAIGTAWQIGMSPTFLVLLLLTKPRFRQHRRYYRHVFLLGQRRRQLLQKRVHHLLGVHRLCGSQLYCLRSSNYV
jgi:MFS family permease